VVRGPETAVGDVHALSLCDYIIGVPSTFNTWAAFAGDKPVYHIREPAARVRLEDFRRCPAPGALRLPAGIRP
jgi:hypothetical protein